MIKIFFVPGYLKILNFVSYLNILLYIDILLVTRKYIGQKFPDL